MANEIRTTVQLNVSKNNLSITKNRAATTDMTGERYSAGIQSIGTTWEAIDIGTDIGTKGVALFLNHDDTNFVEIGPTPDSLDYYAMCKLLPGQFALIPLASNSIGAKADTAAVDLEFLVLEA